MTEIAREAECTWEYLYMCKKLRAFIDSFKGSGNPARGVKDRRTEAVEAWREDDGDDA